jgi:hypothetical protein
MRNLFFLNLFLLACLSGDAQAICGFDVIHHKKMQTDPVYRKAVNENEKAAQHYLSKNKSKLSARTSGVNTALYTIPVVVHVIEGGTSNARISNVTDAQVNETVNYLNDVYNGTYPGTQGIGDLQLQFVLAATDPSCNSTSGIERVDASGIPAYSTNGVSSDFGNSPGVDPLAIKDLSRWNPFQYYNIWVVDKIDGKDGTSGTFVAGFASLPGDNPSSDGIVILASQMMPGLKTLPHEMAHAFGLYHTFEGSADRNSCPPNSNCSSEGDMVCDTDPESFNQLNGIVDFSCRAGSNSCTGTNYSVNTESNYMNYTNCYNLFTAGQKARMLAFASTVYRRSLTTSLATCSTCNPLPVFTPPIPASCEPATSSLGLNNFSAGLLDIDLNNRSIGSSNTAFDKGYVDGAASCLNLLQITKGNSYTLTATVMGQNEEQLRAWIDFNNNGIFENTELVLFANAVPVSLPTVSATFTVPSTATVNTVLRLRIIDDVSNIYGVPLISSGCTDPVYGQAEDYPVYITSNGVLPVTFNSFTGELKNKAALLSWNTSAEQNLKSFDIEKSTNGLDFIRIGTVDALNNSSSSSHYSYTDRNVSENNYYRLRTNETTGAEKLSSVVFLRYNDYRGNLWLVNNPFTNSLEIGCVQGGFPAKLRLLNSVGVVIAEKMVTTQVGRIKWDLQSGLSSGIYILSASAFGQTFTYKVIKE